MPINVSVTANVEALTRKLSMAAYRQIPFATAQAINDTVQDCRKTIPANMQKVFDNPIPYTLKSLRYTKADKQHLSAKLWIEDTGSKGIAPARFLQAEIEGGGRHKKRFESALQARGILPPGMFVTPADEAPHDRYGNVPGSFYAQLLSYFAAFGEQGYRANMTPKRKAKIANVGYHLSGRGREYKTINGAVYFIASKENRMTRHLRPGIYRKTGIHGANVAPVMLFVSRANYSERFKFYDVANETIAANFDAHMSKRLAAAIRTAR